MGRPKFRLAPGHPSKPPFLVGDLKCCVSFPPSAGRRLDDMAALCRTGCQRLRLCGQKRLVSMARATAERLPLEDVGGEGAELVSTCKLPTSSGLIVSVPFSSFFPLRFSSD